MRRDQGKLVFFAAFLGVSVVLIGVLTEFDFQLAAALAGVILTGGLVKYLGETLLSPLSQWFVELFQNEKYGLRIGVMEEIADDLKLLDNLLPEEERILLIIDDLDRCEPTQAVEMLQAIKLLLDFGRCIVLMGVDARVIGAAVEQHYQGLLGTSGASGFEYLDKIIQIPFRIPAPEKEDLAFFLAALTEHPVTVDDPDRVGDRPRKTKPSHEWQSAPNTTSETENSTLSEASAPGLSGLPEHSSENRPELSFSLGELKVLNRLVSHIRPNPRHIKRLVNLYRLIRAIAIRKQDRIVLDNPDITTLWVLMCLQWPQTLHLMLDDLEMMLRDPAEQEVRSSLSDDPLRALFGRVSRSTSDSSRSWDDDQRRLRIILEDESIRNPDLIELRRLRRYAVHVKPWMEAETHGEQVG